MTQEEPYNPPMMQMQSDSIQMSSQQSADPFSQDQGISMQSQGSSAFGQFTPTTPMSFQQSNDDNEYDAEEQMLM